MSILPLVSAWMWLHVEGHTRTFFGVWDDPLPGADQGEVEYEMTRDEWPHRLDH